MKKLIVLGAIAGLALGTWSLQKKEAVPTIAKTYVDVEPPSSTPSKKIESLPENLKRGFMKSLEKVPNEKRQSVLDRLSTRPLFKDNPHLIFELQELSKSIPPYKEVIDLNKKVSAPSDLIKQIARPLKNIPKTDQDKKLKELSLVDPRFKTYPDLELGVKQELARPRVKPTPSKSADESTVEMFANRLRGLPPNEQDVAIKNLRKQYPHYFKKWPELENQIKGAVHEN